MTAPGMYHGNTSPWPMMTASEMQFTIAEASLS